MPPTLTKPQPTLTDPPASRRVCGPSTRPHPATPRWATAPRILSPPSRATVNDLTHIALQAPPHFDQQLVTDHVAELSLTRLKRSRSIIITANGAASRRNRAHWYSMRSKTGSDWANRSRGRAGCGGSMRLSACVLGDSLRSSAALPERRRRCAQRRDRPCSGSHGMPSLMSSVAAVRPAPRHGDDDAVSVSRAARMPAALRPSPRPR